MTPPTTLSPPELRLQGNLIRNTLSLRGSKKHRLPRHLNRLPPRNQMPDTPRNINNTRSTRPPAIRRDCQDQATSNQAAAGDPSAPTVNSSRDTLRTQRTANRKVTTLNSASANHSIQSENSNSRRIKGETQRMGGTSAIDTKNVKKQNSPGSEIKDNDSDDDHDDSEDNAECMDSDDQQAAQRRTHDKEHLRALVKSLSDEQYKRFVVYRRATLNRATVKALLSTLLDQEVSQGLTVVAAGCGKLFVGEMVERALDVMQEWGEAGAIRPEHLREARRRSRREEQLRGIVASTRYGHQNRTLLM